MSGVWVGKTTRRIRPEIRSHVVEELNMLFEFDKVPDHTLPECGAVSSLVVVASVKVFKEKLDVGGFPESEGCQPEVEPV